MSTNFVDASVELSQKSAYCSPTLTKHGEVAELTGHGGSFSGKRTRRRRRRRRPMMNGKW